MPQLDVPLISQPRDSWECGPTSVQMVLEYFGSPATSDQVARLIPVTDGVGSCTFDCGTALLSSGLTVTAISGQPMIFDGSEFGSTLETASLTERLLGAKGWATQDWLLDSLIRFVNNDGKVVVSVPSMAHVKASIDVGNPLLAALRASVLGPNQGFDQLPLVTDFHMVVVTGYREGEVRINNPAPRSHGSSWVDEEAFFYGVHSSTCAYLDTGWLFTVGEVR